MICDNIRISEDGKHLLFAGQDVVELAKKYGTQKLCLRRRNYGNNALRCGYEIFSRLSAYKKRQFYGCG